MGVCKIANFTYSTNKSSRLQDFFYELRKSRALFLMMIPGLIILLLNNFLPMFGAYLAFVNFKFTTNNFIINLFTSEWVGFKNFEFFFKTPDAFIFTRNTLLYNISFIILSLLTAIPVAIALSELKGRLLAGFYQTVMFLPQFLSWVVAAYLFYAFLNTDVGFINRYIIVPLGHEPIQWYNEAAYWPFILPAAQIWKTLGYTSLIYLAAITNIDTEIYEAAIIDGAGKWKQITNITLPHLLPLIITMTLLQAGRVFFADFGLFFQVTYNNGLLYPTTLVIDTYVYNAFRVTGDTGMSAAAGLYQAAVGFVFILVSNLIVRRIDKSSALF